jgi:hypothetical protein
MGETDRTGGGSGVTRRGLLLGGSGALVAAGAGAGLATWRPLHAAPPPPPPVLLAAWNRERTLLAGLAGWSAGDGGARSVVDAVVADHQAHEQALAALLRAYRATPAAPVPGAGAVPSSQLKAAESAAAAAAAREALGLTGIAAALLASISACESTHASLL